jgi:hypothetical protein
MIIDDVRDFISDFNGLENNAVMSVDFIGQDPVHYAIVTLPGARVRETYLNGASEREFPFAFQATLSTADDITRVANSGFYEDFADWFEQQTEAGNLPELGEGKTPLSIEAIGWGYIMDAGESGTAVYQITCRLVYDQVPVTPTPDSPY